MNSFKNPGIKYLIKINSLDEKLNNFISANNLPNVLKTLYKMRITHGTMLNLYTTTIINETNTNKKFIKISYMNTIINLINEKIINSENNFNMYIKTNNIDISNFDKIYDIDKLDIQDDNDDQDELDELDELDNISDKSLPIFNGNKSEDLITREKIESELKVNNYNEFDNNLPSLLFFFNPGCPACINTKPHWDNLKFKLKSSNKLFNILDFNLAEPANNSLSYLFKIEYIPTIIMMESSKVQTAKIFRLEGSADIARIQTFIKESFMKFKNK